MNSKDVFLGYSVSKTSSISSHSLTPQTQSTTNTETCKPYTPIYTSTPISQSNIGEMLDNETNESSNTHLPWNKLSKMVKLKKLNQYASYVAVRDVLNSVQQVKLRKYLKNCLDRKRLNRTKDVIYDESEGRIESIPNLILTDGSRYTLKYQENTDSNINLPSTIYSKTQKNKK